MDVFEGGFEQFLTQLILSQPIESNFVILSGSVAEMPLYYIGHNPTDIDFMNFNLDTCATEKSQTKGAKHVNYMLLDTKDAPLGFARLRLIAKVGEEDFVRHPIVKNKFTPPDDIGHIKVTMHGCASKRTIAYEVSDVGRWLSRLLAGFGLLQSNSNIGLLKMDIVSCIYCRDWPTVAEEFKSRVRIRGWPSNETVMQIVRSGCHLVEKSHHTDPEDKTCWRISFSMAETILINTWTDAQKYIYHVLRIIKRRVVEECGGEDETPVCTYFFKTAMFWACEEKSLEFWKEENVLSSLSEILLTVITDYLIEKLCPNYFIRDCNMMDQLKEFDFTKEIGFMLKYQQQLKNVLENIPRSFPSVFHEISVPNKIILLCFQALARSQLNRFPNRLTRSPIMDILRASGNLSVLKALHIGISEHHGLAMEQRAHVSNATSNRSQMVKMAMSYFRFATNFEESDCSVVKVTTNETILQFVDRLTQHALEGGFCSVAATRPVDKNLLITEIEEKLRFVASLLPPTTYFISVAYFANFYYTYLKDYTFAHRLCHEADIVSRTNFIPLNAMDHYGVILSNRWSPIFDQCLQSVIGFLVLCKDIAVSLEDNNDSKTRSMGRKDIQACVLVNAIPFMKYIAWQCAKADGSLTILDEDFFENPYYCRVTKCGLNEFSKVILRVALLADKHFNRI